MKVLISAYACEPNKGSEPGVGWNWVRAAASSHEVWVLTRANNRSAVEAALERGPIPSLHFIYLDLPWMLRVWKHGRLRVRVYYSLWQLEAARVARALHRQHQFDVVHHLTFANLWFPGLVCAARAPFVLGPCSGGQSVPLRLYPALGLAGSATEVMLRLGKAVSRLNPLVQFTWSRASVIVVNNEETRQALPRRHRRKVLLRTNASLEAQPLEIAKPARRADRPLKAVCAGRLNVFKGVALAIEALCFARCWQLIVIGAGREESRLRRLSERLNLQERVVFREWLGHRELMDEIGAADALVLPSLKEGASFVAVEAQARHVPVVALAQGGPAQLARVPNAQFELVAPGRRSSCVLGLAAALERVQQTPARMFWPDFSLAGVSRDVNAIYQTAASHTPLRHYRRMRRSKPCKHQHEPGVTG